MATESSTWHALQYEPDPRASTHGANVIDHLRIWRARGRTLTDNARDHALHRRLIDCVQTIRLQSLGQRAAAAADPIQRLTARCAVKGA